MNDVTALGTARPDHVADALVYDFDYLRDPEFVRDPFARAERILKEAPPVFWTPHNGGQWFVTGFEAASAAARDWETFSSVLVPKPVMDMILASLPPGAVTPMSALPSNVDPPLHTAYRMPLNTLFSPKVAMALKEEIRGLAVDLIEKVRPAGRCELMSEITEPLPVQMFLTLFGLPVERAEDYRNIVKAAMTGEIHDIQKMIANCQLLVATYTDTLIQRRDHPRDDIISAMWKLEIDGEPMTLHIMQSYCLSLFLAGLDTVMNAMTYGTRHLAMHPELQEKLRNDPAGIVQMTEESLRLYSFAMATRTVARDTEFHGARMKQGERVFLFYMGADRDPAKFDDPEAFLIERDVKTHVGFGAGPHRCVGMHLARTELHVYYEELLKRIPTFRLDPDHPPAYHGGIIVGPDRLNLIWDV